MSEYTMPNRASQAISRLDAEISAMAAWAEALRDERERPTGGNEMDELRVSCLEAQCAHLETVAREQRESIERLRDEAQGMVALIEMLHARCEAQSAELAALRREGGR